MAVEVIISYDGTERDLDALALGRVLRRAGAALSLAYVRHSHEREGERERLAESEARALLQKGAALLETPDIAQHVPVSGSTPEGLRDLAMREHAQVIVFGSEYRTSTGHVDPQASAKRLLDGGEVAIAIAPAGYAEEDDPQIRRIAAIAEDGDPCARETAESLASRLDAAIAERGGTEVDLIVVGSKPGTVTGRVTVSAAAAYLIELSQCPVLVIPRGVTVRFDP